MKKRLLYTTVGILCFSLYSTPVMAVRNNYIDIIPITVQEKNTKNYNEDVMDKRQELFRESALGLDTSDKEKFLNEYKLLASNYDIELVTIYDTYTEKEIKYMQKCIETEFHDCDFDSKVNGANVILNRIDNSYFPDNPIDVVTQKHQFKYGRDKIDDTTVLALEYAFLFKDTTGGCTLFESGDKASLSKYGTYSFTDSSGTSYYILKGDD